MDKKIFIVDDDLSFRETFKIYLEFIEGVKVVGQAVNGKDFLEKYDSKLVDIVFMDIEMPLMDGIEATKKAKKMNKNIKIIALSFHNEPLYIANIKNNGAMNYIVKSEINKNILKEIIFKNFD